MYKKINVALPVNKSLKEALTHTHDFITSNIQFQERVALFIYPIAGASGFFLGGAAGSGDLETMMRKTAVIVLFFVTLAVITPISYYLTKWMYKVSYGKCLTELKILIDELEKPE
jgi:cation transporter-like permease